MKVKALELGYDNVTLRHPDEEFEMPDDVFDAGGKHFFEPADPALKAKYAVTQKAAAKPAVAAVDPAKQSADKQAADEKLAKDQKEQGKKS
jgi:hypothetical protein